MSFSNLRGSSPLYILNCEGVPSVNIGSIVNVSAPFPFVKYGAPMPEMVVDITVKVDEKQGQFFKVPANLDSWEYENNGVKTPYILATSRDAVNDEIGRLRKRAVSIIESVPHNEQVITACDEIHRRLNPEIAEKQRREQEINDLRKQLAEQQLQMTQQQSQMAELIALLKGDKEASKEEKPTKNK